jgi:hypothetical protein
MDEAITGFAHMACSSQKKEIIKKHPLLKHVY